VGTRTQIKCDAATAALAANFRLAGGALALALNGKTFLNPGGRNGALYYANAPSSVVGGTAGLPASPAKVPLTLAALASGSAINIWLPRPCRVDSTLGWVACCPAALLPCCPAALLP
jgi:hypothetical protein